MTETYQLRGEIRFFSHVLDRYVELTEIPRMPKEQVQGLWAEAQGVRISNSGHVKPARIRTAQTICGMCELVLQEKI